MWFSGLGFNCGGDGYIRGKKIRGKKSFSYIKYLLKVEFSKITIIIVIR